MNNIEDVLDLPLDKQRILAKAEDMSLDAWIQYQKKLSQEFEEREALIEKNKGKRPEGWTNENVKIFQMKIDSSVSTGKDELK